MCARVVQFVLPRDRRNKFQFAALQSEVGQRLLAKHGKSTDVLQTVYVVLELGTERERLLARGRAGLRVLRELGLPWSLLYALSVLPTPLLDLGYNLIAKNRYRFGKLDQCMLPKPEWRH